MVRATGRHSQITQLEEHLAGYHNSRGDRLVLDHVLHDWTPTREDLACDYAICHPCAALYLPTAKDTDLGAATKRAADKVTKYDAPCKAHDMVFQAPIIEVFGAMNKSAEDLIKTAAKLVKNELAEGTVTTWTADSFAAFHQQRIAITLQRANAKTIRYRALRDFQASTYLGVAPP